MQTRGYRPHLKAPSSKVYSDTAVLTKHIHGHIWPAGVQCVVSLESSYFKNRDFPGGPVVKTSPSSAGGAGSTPGRELRSHVPRGQKNHNIKRKQYCNKFNKDFKNGPHPKNL